MGTMRNRANKENMDITDARLLGIMDIDTSTGFISTKAESFQYYLNPEADKSIKEQALETEFKRAQHLAMARQYLSFK